MIEGWGTNLNVDLHSHSTASDGSLPPAALVERAHRHGVDLLALTDHDDLRGLAPARAKADTLGLRFVNGVEISVTFAQRTVHIVGLGVDPASEPLNEGLAQVRAGRGRRGREIAQALAQAGIDGALEGALKFAGNPELLSRTHFARYLVEAGVCGTTREVFGRYLVEGKPGYVPHQWARLSDAVGWIRAAGGAAVIAHPGRYKMNPTELAILCEEFASAGGVALEVATSNHGPEQVRRFAALAAEFALEGSRGSDFHAPEESHAELGAAHALPVSVTPVWHRFV